MSGVAVQGLQSVYTRLVYAASSGELLAALQAQGLRIYALEVSGFSPMPSSVQVVQAAATEPPTTPSTPPTSPSTSPPSNSTIPIPMMPKKQGECLLRAKRLHRWWGNVW